MYRYCVFFKKNQSRNGTNSTLNIDHDNRFAAKPTIITICQEQCHDEKISVYSLYAFHVSCRKSCFSSIEIYRYYGNDHENAERFR